MSEYSSVRFGKAAEQLFRRLPERIFSPLASANRQQFWTLLCALHVRRFGPDAPLAPSEGFAQRDMTRDIEDVLVELDWEEEGEDPATPLGIRANMVLQRLIETGWLRTDRHGVEKRVGMSPAVSQFLTQLVTFAETGPLFVAGKVRSIDANLRIVSDEMDGDSLAEAAEQARNLLEHVRNTGLNVRDVMAALTPELSTGEYVRRFFSDYVTDIFIGDYRELRTREHPLSRRQHILDLVERLAGSAEVRSRLLSSYQTRRCSGDEARAKRLLERDFDRLRELSRIDEYLDRLDSEVRRANKLALTFLDYRLRSLRPVDDLLKRAINALVDAPEVVVPCSPGPMLASESLAEPRRTVERPLPDALRRSIPTDRDIALMRIANRILEARQITPERLAAFVASQKDEQGRISSDGLNIDNIEAVVAKQVLADIALAMGGTEQMRRNARALARGFDVMPDHGEPESVDTPLSGRRFAIKIRER